MEDGIEEGLDVYGWITHQLEYYVPICENLIYRSINIAYKVITDEIIHQILENGGLLLKSLARARMFVAGLMKEVGVLLDHFMVVSCPNRARMSYVSMQSMKRIVDFLDFFRLNPNLPSINFLNM